MKRFACLLVMLSLIMLSCHKDETSTPKDQIHFNGISETDVQGFPLSFDTTDWRVDDQWNSREMALFTETKPQTCNNEGEEYHIAAYPNPCSDVLNLHVTKPADSRMAFRIVDRYYKVLLSGDSAMGNLTVNLNDNSIKNDTIRVYYKIFKENCELRGHGDIRVNAK
jgi:hypothetical protein